jgi:hypothetical protein
MRQTFVIILICFASRNVLSQKVLVQVTKSKNVARSEWQILDGQNLPVFSGNEDFREDSIVIFLEANKRYFIEISVSDIYNSDTSLYSLSINGEPILNIMSDQGPGDHFYAFFTGLRKDQGKITGGTSADIADYPWQVFYEAGNYTCGGSIISGDWIITAAHCTEDNNGNAIPVSQMDVVVGANNPRTGLEGKKYFVSKVLRHENYDRITLNNDIALLQLKATINYENATPIRLVSRIDSASGATDPGVMSWISGYGLTRVSPPSYPTTLQKVQIPIVSNTQASSVWKDIPPTDLMAGYRSGNKDACSGDSGGPMVVPVDNSYKLAGIVSWGSSNCNTYGAYTRISTFESWISTNTGIEISFVPPVPSGDSIVCKGVVTSDYNVGTIEGASSYEWQLLPSSAGSILGSEGKAIITWDQDYTGPATVRLRITRYNIVSYWSALTVHIAEYNKLVSKSNDTIICAGQPVTLKVVSEGYDLNYSWYKNNILVKSGTSPGVSFSNPLADDSGVYKCNIAGSCGAVISTEINLIVYPVTIIKSITPNTDAPFGTDVVLNVDADGHNLLYQWQKDGNQIPEATYPEFTLVNVDAGNTGLYRVNVAGSCGELLSSNVYLYVREKEYTNDPEIFVWPTLISNELNVALSNEQNYNFLLFSSVGKLLKEKHDCQYKTTLNIPDLPAGIYILNVYGDNFRKSVKLIKN